MADIVLADRFTEPKPAAPAGAEAAGRGGRAVGGGTATASLAARSSDYVGTYYSDEVDASFTVTAKDGQLMVRRDADAEPAGPQPTATSDQFRFRTMTVRFGRGPTVKVEALLVDAGRVRDIRFVRR